LAALAKSCVLRPDADGPAGGSPAPLLLLASVLAPLKYYFIIPLLAAYYRLGNFYADYYAVERSGSVEEEDAESQHAFF